MKYERNEYPRPTFRRDEWLSLNGEWNFEFCNSATKPKTFTEKINVPFSYQWKASGINDRAQHDVVWYNRKFTIPKSASGKRALLCFNASDYMTEVWVNGNHATAHKGGFAPFSVDITELLKSGENELTVRCSDTLDSSVPRGKQSWTGNPFACFYYPNSGIWQSVWIEFFDVDCIDGYSLQSDIDNRTVYGYINTLHGSADEAEITFKFKDKQIKKVRISLDGPRTEYSVRLTNTGFDFGDMLWTIETPNLVYVDFELFKDGKVCDIAHTRMGLRKIYIDADGRICLNDRPIYQRLILDQGYWEESGLTPPSAAALKKDIELSKAMGFNGARKHQKFEDPYYYYYAEELGFLVWCEMPSAYTFCEKEVQAVSAEWLEIVNTAKNFTSVIAYVPLNESWGVREIKTSIEQQNFARSLYYLTKSVDNTRLVSTNDGFENIEQSDILSVHDYRISDADEIAQKYKAGEYDGMYPQGWALFADGNTYKGQPVLLTEFGGIAFATETDGDNWGYNDGAKDSDELCLRLDKIVKGIARTEMQGYCYTQLTDVQQEVNGLLYADRTPKVGLDRLKKIFENK